MSQSQELRARSRELLDRARRLRRQSEQLLVHREQVCTRVILSRARRARRPVAHGTDGSMGAPSPAVDSPCSE